jgi:WD40 repeat protein
LRPKGGIVQGYSLDPSGDRLALEHVPFSRPGDGSVEILDLASGEERVLKVEDARGGCSEHMGTWGGTPAWLPDGRLVSDGVAGLRLWDLSTGTSQQLRSCRPAVSHTDAGVVRVTPDGRFIVSLAAGAPARSPSELTVFELATGATREITTHGTRVQAFALDSRGSILVTGDSEGLVRVGPLHGGEPHLLYGHARSIASVAVSPDAEWIASGSDDGTIRLWPMPAGPLLHTLPYEALLAKLRALTNLRVEPDEASPSGYRLEPGAFPGWGDPPEW